MFRRWPFFQRLLSWTKPHAPVERGTRAYERYDWNSLLGETPETRAIQPELMDGTSYFPSRPEMEANLVAFADRAGVAIRYGCRWTATGSRTIRADAGSSSRRPMASTRCAALVVAVGVAEPQDAARPWHGAHAHYADVRPAETYAGKRVFIIGKQNSGFELATGLLPWARQLILSSPSPARLSVDTRSLVGIRARYVQPYEDHVLGGGVSVLDAAIDRIERAADGTFVVRLRRTDGGADMAIEADEVIAATGFVTPLVDLPALGVATFGASAAAGPDAVVGERQPAGRLLRRDHRPGRQGAPEARYPGQLRGRPRRAIQRQGAGRVPRPDPVRDRARAAERRAGGRVRLSWPGSWPRGPSCSTSAATSPAC